MNGVMALTTEIVAYKNQEVMPNLFQEDKESIGNCPRCGHSVFESKKNFYCENKECPFVMWKEDRFFTDKKTALTTKQAKTLLEKGNVKLTGLYSQKTGKKYDAYVILNAKNNYVTYTLGF